MRFRTVPALALAVSAFGLLAGGCSKGGSSVAPGGVIPVIADGDGFKPSSVKLVKGSPAALVFTRTTDDTCATEVVFPELDIKKPLPKDTPVRIDLPSDKARTLTFQCGMGMYKSSVVIVDK